MAGSHRRHRQDKTDLSCLVGVRGVNWIGDKIALAFYSILRSNTVPSLSNIEQSAVELLRFEYLTLWPWTCITCCAMFRIVCSSAKFRGVNWIGDKSRLSATENCETILSSLEMPCELSIIFSWPSFQFATWLPIVETGLRLVHKWVHTSYKTGQNCSVSNILQTVCDCRELSSHLRQDKTRQSCLVGVAGVN